MRYPSDGRILPNCDEKVARFSKPQCLIRTLDLLGDDTIRARLQKYLCSPERLVRTKFGMCADVNHRDGTYSRERTAAGSIFIRLTTSGGKIRGIVGQDVSGKLPRLVARHVIGGKSAQEPVIEGSRRIAIQDSRCVGIYLHHTLTVGYPIAGLVQLLRTDAPCKYRTLKRLKGLRDGIKMNGLQLCEDGIADRRATAHRRHAGARRICGVGRDRSISFLSR